MSKIIILEGLPRTGKTTVGRALAEEIDVTFKEEVYVMAGPGKKQWSLTHSDDEVAWWYLSEDIRRLDEADKSPEAVQILDRSYISTLAYCHARYKLDKIGEVDQKLKLVRGRVLRAPRPKVGHVLFFDDSPEVSFQRIQETWETHRSQWNRLGFLRSAYEYSQWFIAKEETAPVSRLRGGVGEKLRRARHILYKLRES